MELEQAQDILAHIVENRVRWGKMYDASDVGIDKLTEALIALSQGDLGEAETLRTSLTKANRQLGASNARETKLKKTIEELRAEVAGLTALADRLSGQLPEGRDGEGGHDCDQADDRHPSE